MGYNSTSEKAVVQDAAVKDVRRQERSPETDLTFRRVRDAGNLNALMF